MFPNFLKKIADRDHLIVFQYFFDFTSEGEQNCKIKVLSYDLNGDVRKEEDLSKIDNDFIFFTLYGSYILVWLAQIFDDVLVRNDNTSFQKIISISTILFGSNQPYSFPDALALSSQETKRVVIEKRAAVQFKIHKITKNSLVRVVNTPITQETECQMYLFVILFDFFCKKYPNAYKLLNTACTTLIKVMMENKFSTHKPFQVIAYEIASTMAENEFNKLEAV